MDHLIGQRFSLISKSEIRYVGILHEINPEQSTIALEEVYSFGTEDRAVDSFIPPSQQKFEYIVFRGSDVKDIKIAEEQKENKQSSPPAPPNDPAILNSSRPGPPAGPHHGPPQPNRDGSPFPPPGYPQHGQYGGYYPPPPPGQFGRGFGPPPHGGYGPGPGFPHYGPPPGFFGPPGQGFPPGPNQFPQQHPSGPPGPPGQRQATPNQGPAPPGATNQPPKPTQELPGERAAPNEGNRAPQVPPPAAGPAPSAQLKTEEPPQSTQGPVSYAEKASKPAPAASKSNRVTPAVPLTVNQKSFTPPVVPGQAPATSNGTSKPGQSQAAMEDASRQAKEAVAAAMAKLNPQATAPKPAMPGNAVDELAKKVSEMGTGYANARGRGGPRGGRGARGAPGGQNRKIEIPKSDFDFESANAKFNKEDLIKEAIASGSPLGETPEDQANGELEANSSEAVKRKDSLPQNTAAVYNRSTSFFDNISSESKDREDRTDGRSHARAMRGQEFKKNIETFGQGNVDSGFRGRGRGGYRGYRGGGGGGYRGGNFRGRGRGGAANPAPAQS